MADRILYLFPDTNLFIQCRPLSELGWDRWGAFDEIHLIVSRPVQAEIDKHKNRGNDRVAKRARTASSLLREIIGHEGDRYLYIIGSFAVFIFISNIFGLFYFLQPPTSNPNTTFALALTSFLYYNYQGIKTQGLLHYLKHFGGPVWWLFPLMFVIEIIANFARILSLGMRLFGNIFGEHTATGIFSGLVPILVPWPMMALGIFGALLQTFVFIMLTMVYISGAIAVEEH